MSIKRTATRGAETKGTVDTQSCAPAGSERSPSETKPTADACPFFPPFALALFSAIISFLAFPGFDLWPLAFVCLVPLYFAMDWKPRLTNKQAVAIAVAFGFTGMWGGYYWVVTMLRDFSGFSLPLCILFASLLHLAQGGMMALFALFYYRLRGRGWPALLAAPMAHVAAEFVYPILFPYYYGNHLHEFPIFFQIADLGGPLLVTALVNIMNVGVYLVVRQLILHKKIVEWKEPTIAAALTAAVVGYGFYRIADVDARIASAEAITIGMPQVSMPIFEKRENPANGQRRTIEMSLEIESEASPDLLIWPESAYTFFLPESATNVKHRVMGPVSTPLLFGGLQRRRVNGRERKYNTVFMADGDGEILGSYDKTYLLAFGEYLPFGEQFPFIYKWSPHSGRLTPGDHVRPVPFRDYRISVLICYEDIIPAFVRKVVREANPHLLVNITNDAWFGDTTEPWQHLALAKFRAVEHHRYLVRSTNSGVSAIIDPLGRVLEHTGVFTTESLTGEVYMMEANTLYSKLGDWPGYFALLFCIIAGWLTKRRSAHVYRP